MPREKPFKLTRADIQMTFANWIDDYRKMHPDAVLPSPAQYTDNFINSLPEKNKI